MIQYKIIKTDSGEYRILIREQINWFTDIFKFLQYEYVYAFVTKDGSPATLSDAEEVIERTIARKKAEKGHEDYTIVKEYDPV